MFTYLAIANFKELLGIKLLELSEKFQQYTALILSRVFRSLMLFMHSCFQSSNVNRYAHLLHVFCLVVESFKSYYLRDLKNRFHVISHSFVIFRNLQDSHFDPFYQYRASMLRGQFPCEFLRRTIKKQEENVLLIRQ